MYDDFVTFLTFPFCYRLTLGNTLYHAGNGRLSGKSNTGFQTFSSLSQ